MSRRKPDVQVRRVYDPREDDGTRVLVDRLWPRGISKDRAHWDEWCTQIAPSHELRTWYRHDPSKFAEFSRRYQNELTHPDRAEALTHLRDLAHRGTLTLLTATTRPDISQATVLAQLIEANQIPD